MHTQAEVNVLLLLHCKALLGRLALSPPAGLGELLEIKDFYYFRHVSVPLLISVH